jgi:hypothetical protein
MPRSKKVTRTNGSPLVHTNHCLHSETVAEEGERLPQYVESSNQRLEVGNRSFSDLEAFFAHPHISRRASEPHLVATCGAVVMEPSKREMRAVWGVPGDHPWETFHL